MNRYQKRSGKCQLIFLLVLLIMGCLIVIAYRPTRSPTSSSSTPAPTEDTGDQGRIANQEEIAQKLIEELDGRRLRMRESQNTKGDRGVKRRRERWR